MRALAESNARRVEFLRHKHEEARSFVADLAALEAREWDPVRRDDIARRRREVEVQCAHFQKTIAEIEEANV